MTNLQDLNKHKNFILAIANKNGAKNVRIFGSVSRGDIPRLEHLLKEKV